MSEGTFDREEYWRKKEAKKNKKGAISLSESQLSDNGEITARKLKEAERELSETEVIDQMYDYMQHFNELITSGTCPDVCIFALKAALPIGVMTKELWGSFYPDSPMPAIRYANIGLRNRAQYGYIGNDPDNLKFDYVPPVVQSLDTTVIRNTYVQKDSEGFSHPYARILCVDDFSQTGTTISEMKRVFHDAFPESTVTSYVVLNGVAPWYKDGNSNIDMLGVQDWNEEEYERRTVQELNSRHRQEDFIVIEGFQDIIGRSDKDALSQEYNAIEKSLRNSPYVTATHDLDRATFAEGRALLERIITGVKQKKAHNVE